MDHLEIRSNITIDLEMGGSAGEDDEAKGLGSVNKEGKKNPSKNGFLSSMEKMSDDDINSSKKKLGSSGNLEILVGEGWERAKISENGMVNEKGKKGSAKPPLPPRGPSLDAADLELLKQLSELARLKRKRTQRLKALKKKRAEKASSSSSNIFPMIVTIVFFSVIIFQGLLGSRI